MSPKPPACSFFLQPSSARSTVHVIFPLASMSAACAKKGNIDRYARDLCHSGSPVQSVPCRSPRTRHCINLASILYALLSEEAPNSNVAPISNKCMHKRTGSSLRSAFRGDSRCHHPFLLLKKSLVVVFLCTAGAGSTFPIAAASHGAASHWRRLQCR